MWKTTAGANTLILAVYHHFAQKFAKYRYAKGESHPDEWTLKFLGKVVCE